MRLIRSAALGAVLLLATAAPTLGAARHAPAAATRHAHYRRPPATGDSWFWELAPPRAGLAGLPGTSARYPAPGSAHIWDTDLFQDSNTSHGATLNIPTGRSPVVKAIHAAGHYSICYVEVGAFQTGFPDNADFAPADYGDAARRYQMQGYPNEWYFDIAGFRNYVAGRPGSLTGCGQEHRQGTGETLQVVRARGTGCGRAR